MKDWKEKRKKSAEWGIGIKEGKWGRIYKRMGNKEYERRGEYM